MQRERGRRRRIWSGVVLPVVVAAVAPAAGAGQRAAADTIPADTAVLPHPTLVVRVLRTPSASTALPYAVTVRSLARDVPGTGSSLGDAVRAVPGLQVDDRHNDALGDRIVMRGFGARSQFGVRGLQVAVDGIPATMPDGQATLSHLDVALLERAEVLRGPAAAAHGNAAGGVILLSTAPPPAAPFRHEGEVTAGDDGLLRFRSTSGGRPGRIGWLASVSRSWQDGFRPHSGADRWHWTGRLEAPAGGGELRVVTHGVAYDADNPGALTREQLASDPRQAQPFNVTQRTGETGHHGQVGAAWERPVGAVRIEALAYALARDIDNPIPPSIIELGRRAGGARLLARSADAPPVGGVGLPERPAWAAGVDVALQRDDRRTFDNEGGEPGVLTLDQDERVTSVAVHGQGMLPVTRSLAAFAALRYDRIAFAADDHLVTPENPDDSGGRTLSSLSPTAGVRLRPGPTVTVFGNVSTAFETPTTTELVNRPDGSGGFNEGLEPQRTTSWEVGAEVRPAPGLRVQGSAYHARVRDALVPFEVASAPGRQYYRNAAAAVHRGAELVAELRTRRLNALASYSRVDAEFDEYVVEGVAYDGRAIPGVRPWTVEGRLVARAGSGITLQVDARSTGDMAVDDANDAWADGYSLLAVRASAPLRVGRLDFGLYGGVENVLDEPYVSSVVPNAFGARYYEPGPGRSLYLGIRTRVTVGDG